jgi:hypothetical protein
VIWPGSIDFSLCPERKEPYTAQTKVHATSACSQSGNASLQFNRYGSRIFQA